MKALITGASSGIGRDITKELAKKGYDVILVARDEEKMTELAQEIETNVQIIAMDLSIEENCKKLYEMVKDENIDILINNAGFGVHGDFSETDLEKEIAMINTNIIAMHILMKLFLKDMRERNRGIILNVSSSAGFMPGPLMSAYYASKAYVLRLTEGIKEELKKSKSKVQLSVLCPGPVKTNFSKVAGVDFGMQSLSSEYVAKYTVNKILKGKFIIVPGFTMKIIRFFTKVTPNTIVSKISYKVNFKKYKQSK